MLSLSIATRFLRKSPVQSILIAAGIAVGIGVQVFLGSLITSLQSSLVDQTIGNSPQVVVTAGRKGSPSPSRPQLEQAMEAQSEITTVVPTRDLLGHLPQGQRERAAADHRRRARRSWTASTTSRAAWSPVRRRSRPVTGHRRQGLRRHVRPPAGGHGVVRAPHGASRPNSGSPACSTSAPPRPTAPSPSSAASRRPRVLDSAPTSTRRSTRR